MLILNEKLYKKFYKIAIDKVEKKDNKVEFYYCAIGDKFYDFIPSIDKNGRLELLQLFTLPIQKDVLIDKVYSTSTIIKKYGIKSFRKGRILKK